MLAFQSPSKQIVAMVGSSRVLKVNLILGVTPRIYSNPRKLGKKKSLEGIQEKSVRLKSHTVY
jgi:hypothetical protein